MCALTSLLFLACLCLVCILSLVLLGGIWFGTLLVVGAKLRGVRRIILVVREISTFLIDDCDSQAPSPLIGSTG